MLEYGRLVWLRIFTQIARFPKQEKKLLSRFDRSWMARGVFGKKFGDRVLWRQRGPSRDIIIQPLVPE
jgi:hypothetical protein